MKRRTSASGVGVEVFSDPDDLYFQSRLASEDNFEPAVSVASLTMPSDGVAIDLGACLGIVSVALGQLAPLGEVLAVEASPSLIPGLTETCKAALNSNVEVISSAVGASLGSAGYHLDPTGGAWGYVTDNGGESVPQITIDHLVDSRKLRRVDLMKLDIEGHELSALHGAERTVEDHHPVLVVEINPFCLWRYGRTLPQDLVDWIRERYEFLWAIDEHAHVVPLTSDVDVDAMLASVGTSGGLVDLVASRDPIDFPSPLWVAPSQDVMDQEGEPQRRSLTQRLTELLRR